MCQIDGNGSIMAEKAAEEYSSILGANTQEAIDKISTTCTTVKEGNKALGY
jgi:hypothetical protein